MRLAPPTRRWLRLAPVVVLLLSLGTAAQAQPLTASGARHAYSSDAFAYRPPVTAYGYGYGTSRSYRRGYYETRCERVWVPGSHERVWVAPRYEWRREPCGRRYQVLVCAGHYTQRQLPGRYETRTVRVWVPARRVEVRPSRHRVTHVGRRYR